MSCIDLKMEDYARRGPLGSGLGPGAVRAVEGIPAVVIRPLSSTPLLVWDRGRGINTGGGPSPRGENVEAASEYRTGTARAAAIVDGDGGYLVPDRDRWL